MKQTIEIEVPDGMRAIWKNNKVIFEDIKPQLPKTWKEFCEQNEIKKSECYLDTSSSCIIERWVGERDISSDRNLLPSKEAAEAHLALMQLHQLRDCYRQGWIPTEDKVSFGITKRTIDTCLSIDRFMYYSKFLSFPTREIAEEFLTNFRELIEQAGDLI